MFENKMIDTKYGPTHLSRLIASWYIAGGPRITRYAGRCEFGKWLKSYGIDDETIYEAEQMAINGKLEFQQDAKKYFALRGIEPIKTPRNYIS